MNEVMQIVHGLLQEWLWFLEPSPLTSGLRIVRRTKIFAGANLPQTLE
jgi:hypothetical protein